MSGFTEFGLRTLVVAILVIAVVLLIKRWGPFPSKDPEKIARWQVLPLRFKFACWFGVTPLFIFAVVLGASLSGLAGLLGLFLLMVAWVGMELLESRVIVWYRENGHFRSYNHQANEGKP